MSTELKDQIRSLASQVEAVQDAVTIEDVRLRIDRDETEPVVGRFPPRRVPRPGRRRWVVVLAAVVVIILFGAVALMLPGDEPMPPADTVPPLPEGTSFEYVTSAVPDGLVVRRVGTSPSGLLYLREVDRAWVPSDGGVFLDAQFETRFGSLVDVEDRFATVLDAVPGSRRVDLGGRPAIVFESSLEEWSTPLIWILGSDGQGGLFEIGTTGLDSEEALTVARGVHRVSVEDYLSLGSQITWDLTFGMFTDGAEYEVPELVNDLGTSVQVAVGIETLFPRLGSADQSQPVITTETGEVVEFDEEPIRARAFDLFIEAPDDGIGELLNVYPHAELSPQQHQESIDAYVETLRGPVLSEEPFVMQAVPGPEPRFDVTGLGTELPLEPATSADVVPTPLLGGFSEDLPVSTEARPIMVLGTVREPGSEREGVVALLWFTEKQVICEATASDSSGMGSGCGFEIQARFGQVSGSSGAPGGGGDVRYQVPLETSVVQIITPGQNYWQRPVGGWVIVPYGDTVERPTRILAFDVQGGQIGGWETQSE